MIYRDALPLNIILEEISQSIDSESRSKFNICRTNVWGGVVRALKRKSFSASYKMSVKFTGDYGQSEGAVDQRGPKREMLTLVMLELQNSRMFANSSNDHGKHLENWGQGKKCVI